MFDKFVKKKEKCASVSSHSDIKIEGEQYS